MCLRVFFSTVAGGLLLCAQPSFSQTVMLFEDGFDGASLSPAKWRTDILTSGVRWCDPNAGYGGGPGVWFDPATETCYGIGQGPPFGTSSVGNGLADFSSQTGNRGFPYAWTGPPTPGSPFSVDADFTLRIRMRFSRIASCGSGITVLEHADATPTANIAPAMLGQVLLQVWADGRGVTVAGINADTYYTVPLGVAAGLDFHEYVVTLRSGAYEYFVDGAQVYGPVPSAVRPTTIQIGNPVFTYWAGCDWTSFSVDYVGVKVPGATPAARGSWGQVKDRYRK